MRFARAAAFAFATPLASYEATVAAAEVLRIRTAAAALERLYRTLAPTLDGNW